MIQLVVIDANGLAPERLPARLFSRARRQRLLQLSHPEVRRSSAAAELALIAALARRFPDFCPPAEYDYDADGKPGFADGRAYFSLSHSGGYAACALSDAPVGVDIETRMEIKPTMVCKIASQAEIDAGGVSPRRLAELWCVKESMLKLTGEGLSGDMRAFTVFADEAIRDTGARFLYRVFDTEKYHLSVAAQTAFDCERVCLKWDEALSAFPE